MQSLVDRFVLIRARATHFFPYLGYMIQQLVPVQTKKVPTMAVDRWWRLYMNPDFVLSISLDQAAGVLIHECYHLLRQHAEQCIRMGLDQKLWNLAGDLAINDDLVEMAGISLPNPVLPSTFGFKKYLLEEAYYQLLLEIKAQVESVLRDLLGKDGAGICAGDCGSGADGDHRGWERPAPKGSEAGSGVPGVTPDEAENILGKVAQDILEHEAKHPGSVPGAMRRAAERIRTPKVPWRQKLRSSIREAVRRVCGQTHSTYRKRSRRQGNRTDIILRAHVGGICNVALGIDTSGSVTSAQLGQALAESHGMLRDLQRKIKLTVLSVDAAVAKVQQVFHAANIELFGGGGTDMGVAVEAAAELNPAPDVIVIITDGYTSWPDAPPPGAKKVIVVILTQPGTKHLSGFGADYLAGPDWADCIYVDVV